MDSMVFENWSDFGILIEIMGFALILFFWKFPTYSDLHAWKKSQILYKFIFGEEKYVRRISDNKSMDEDDTITRTNSILGESDNKVPREFLRFWNIMKTLSFMAVILGLGLQFCFFNRPC